MEQEFPKRARSRGGNTHGYSIEARTTYPEPQEICGMLLGKDWQQISLCNSPNGVPAHRSYDFAVSALGYLGYEAAQALRWSFLAQAAASGGDYCLETRLVKHKIEYKAEAIKVCEVDVLDWGESSSPREEVK